MRALRTFSISIALAMCFVAPAVADSLEEGVAAYRIADYTTALRLYRALADQGLDVAQFNLGLMYANGQGVLKDEAEAIKWYRLAAGQGRADAQYQLGNLYYEQNIYPEAVRWFRLAAEQGRADAQSNLGVMYADGDGVAQDYVLAYMWFSLAAAQDHREAIDNRDSIASLMSPTQIAEAQKRAREWKRTPQSHR